MFRNMRIGAKILLTVLLIALGSLLLISLLSYTRMLDISAYFQSANDDIGRSSSESGRQALLGQADSYLMKLADERANCANMTLKEISGDVTRLSQYIESLYQNPDNFIGRLPALADEAPDGAPPSLYALAPGTDQTSRLNKELRLISNAEYAFAPVFKGSALLDSVYLGTETGIFYRYSASNAYNSDYDPRQRDWYLSALATPDKTVWLDTYTDIYGTVCVTCCRAFYGADGNIAGAVAMDITLKSMFESITDAKIGQTGYAFIFDSDMEYIAHPRCGEADFPLTPMETASGDTLKALTAIKNGDSGMLRMTLDGVDSLVTFAVLPETGWKMCMSVDVDEIVAPADEAAEVIEGITAEAGARIRRVLSNIVINYIILFVCAGLLVVAVSLIVSKSITRPISELAKAAGKIGAGDLEAKAEVKSHDEIGELAATFNSMTGSLKKYISDLTSVTAEKERIATELNVARDIQASMLPGVFPPFPDIDKFDIYAAMRPAKEVGGDFYDFFMPDKDHLALVIADVSGKGVPAALFMVIAKTMIKNCALESLSPKKVFEKVNAQLCENNKLDMFVTVWMGMLQLSTGTMVCANAGHEYPAIRKASGRFELYKDKHGFVLAGMDSSRYDEYELSLEPGDRLFVYTDGATEAADSRNAQFGEERLLKALNRDGEASCEKLIENVKADIDAFVGDAPQFDDITMLSVSIK